MKEISLHVWNIEKEPVCHRIGKIKHIWSRVYTIYYLLSLISVKNEERPPLKGNYQLL